MFLKVNTWWSNGLTVLHTSYTDEVDSWESDDAVASSATVQAMDVTIASVAARQSLVPSGQGCGHGYGYY